MKMRAETIQIYKYEELGKEAQEKAIGQFSEINVADYDWWQSDVDFICENIKEKTGLEIKPIEIYFELFSRSNCIYIESSVLINALISKYPKISDFGLPEKFGLFCHYLGGGLCSGLFQSDFDVGRIDFYQYEEEKFERIIEEKKDKILSKKIGQDLIKVMSILEKGYKGLYESHSYLTGREAIEDTITANEYEFLQNGERA